MATATITTTTTITSASLTTFVAIAIAVRTLLMLLLVVACVVLVANRPYDTSAEHVDVDVDVDVGAHGATTTRSLLLYLLLHPLSRLHHWDALHFQGIATHGYYHEKLHAFWPLVPALFRGVRACIADDAYVPLAVFAWNATCFAVASIAFARLSALVFPQDAALVRLATLFFVFNPASIFFTAAYTESTFAAASFVGMWAWSERRRTLSTLFFMLASMTRSNGILLCALLVCRVLQECLPRALQLRGHPIARVIALTRLMGPTIAVAAVQCCAIVAPYIAFSWWSARKYCSDVSVSAPSYCSDRLVPSIYGYIQSTYWNVGFLRYYRADQVPNFMLAAPVWSFAGYALYHCVRSWRTHRAQQHASSSDAVFGSKAVMPFLLHLALAFGVCTTIMHVQVSTRFLLSSSPVLPWAMAAWCLERPSKSQQLQQLHTRLRCVATWSLFYTCIGTLLFTSFLPWT